MKEDRIAEEGRQGARGEAYARTEQVCRLLEIEIQSAEHAASRPGWTPWAIAAAIASLGWIVISEITLPGVRWDNVGFIAASISVSLDVCFILMLACSSGPRSTSRSPRFTTTSEAPGSTKLYGTALLLRETLLFWLLSAAFPWLPHGVPWVARVFVLWNGLCLGTALVLSFLEYVLPVQTRTGKAALYWVLHIGLGVYASFLLWVNCRSASVHELRIAAALSVASVLLLLLVRVNRQAPLVDQMRDLYRDLCLGRLELQDAIKQADLLLYGLTFEAAVQRRIASVMDLLRSERDHMGQAATAMRAIKAAGSAQGRSWTPEGQTTVEALFTSADGHLGHAVRFAEESKIAVDRFYKAAAFLRRLEPGAGPDIVRVLERFKQELDLSVREHSALKQEAASAHAALTGTGETSQPHS